MKLHTDTLLNAKFGNDISTFFVDNPDQKLLLFHHLLGRIDSNFSPHFIWTGPWLDWKTLFVKLHIETFIGAKFDTTWVLFSQTTQIKKFFLLHHLLARIHSYSSPLSFWTSSWPDWKTLFVKLHTDALLSAKFDNDMNTFFRRQPRSKIFSVSEPTRMHRLLL